MLNPPLVFKTYQDVKVNLVYWTFLLLVLFSLAVHFLYWPPQIRDNIMSWILYLGNNNLAATVVIALLVATYFGIAIVLIFGLELHDKVYDRHLIKWRKRFDTQTILPNLTRPFAAKLPPYFLSLATQHKYEFMKPYYDFVGDGRPGIQENTRIRFYERVTWYWATQMNELLLIFTAAITIVCSLIPAGFFPLLPSPVILLALLLLAYINRRCVRATLAETTHATLDEIEEILTKPQNISQLETSYLQLCSRYPAPPTP